MTLAEKLRAYMDADQALASALEALDRTEASTWTDDERACYLRGYDDAMAQMKNTLDFADCTWREGAGIYHCAFDNPCAVCQWRHEAEKLTARVRELEKAVLDEHSRLAQEEAKPAPVGAVPDAVVVAAAYALYVDTCVSEDPKPWNMLKNSDKEYFTDVARTVIRAAIAALAQALGEEG